LFKNRAEEAEAEKVEATVAASAGNEETNTEAVTSNESL